MLFNTLYWYLDEFCCVLIKRNRLWFESALPKIKEIWNIILKERVEGYEHRASKKKLKTDIVVKNLPLTNHICLVKLSENESNIFQSLM